MNIQRLLSPRQAGGKGAALRAKRGRAILPPHHFVESGRVKGPAFNRQTHLSESPRQAGDGRTPHVWVYRCISKYLLSVTPISETAALSRSITQGQILGAFVSCFDDYGWQAMKTENWNVTIRAIKRGCFQHKCPTVCSFLGFSLHELPSHFKHLDVSKITLGTSKLTRRMITELFGGEWTAGISDVYAEFSEGIFIRMKAEQCLTVSPRSGKKTIDTMVVVIGIDCVWNCNQIATISLDQTDTTKINDVYKAPRNVADPLGVKVKNN